MVDSATRPGNDTPALWTSTSSSLMAAVAAGIASVSATSSASVVAPNRSAVACSAGDGRPAKSRVWVGAKASAIAAPIPRLAPVMSAVALAPMRSKDLRRRVAVGLGGRRAGNRLAAGQPLQRRERLRQGLQFGLAELAEQHRQGTDSIGERLAVHG